MIEAEEQERYWKSHYDGMAASAAGWLDFGNERVQSQTLALALELAAPIPGNRCVDIGCGRGQLCLALRDLGASEVIGADASAALLERVTSEHPGMQWIGYSLLQAPEPAFGQSFDRVFAVEVLQYVPLDLALDHLWRLTAPGGRLVGVVPNRDCPFIADAIARFGGRYAPPAVGELEATLRALVGVKDLELRGMWYTQQPEGLPYRSAAIVATQQTQPNRLLFAVNKRVEHSSPA